MSGKLRHEKRSRIHAWLLKYAHNRRLMHSGLSSAEEGIIKQYSTKSSAISQSGGILPSSVVVKISGRISIIGPRSHGGLCRNQAGIIDINAR